MASNTFEKYHIEKLNDSNYGNWKFKMERVLKGSNLWKATQGTDIAADDATEAVQEAMELREEKAFLNWMRCGECLIWPFF